MTDSKVDGVIYRKKDSEYFKRNYSGPLNATWFGVRADGTDITSAAQKAFAFATKVGSGVPVFFPAGVYTINGTLSLSGYSCGILGEAASTRSVSPTTGAVGTGTVFKCINQTGPVIDLTGFISPANFIGNTVFSNFAVLGDNTPNVANKGINIPDIVTSISLENILISNTGGIGLDLGKVYISDFTNISIFTPVNVQDNNVNYLRLTGANGNRFNRLVFRSLTSTKDTAPSGAINVQGDGVFYPSHDNIFYACTFEFLHVPTNGCLINSAGNTNIFSDTTFFDCSKELGATGTCVFRMNPSNVRDFGGNVIRGYVPGRGTAPTDINFDYGVEVFQNNNSIEGIKGFRGYNVHLNTGVSGTSIRLSASESNGTDVGVVDDSGVVTNNYIDEYLETVKRNSYVLRGKSLAQGGFGLGVEDYTNSAIGYLALGNQGVGLQNAAAATKSL
ncbi:MAG TPA: glycosyl hydrolase family 28-related protein, partial [Candidatus Babeliaceae bacterium]|nr:glycosyl hydrolase family 28-related protein [Candidatus Babeliaceae bacterium]